VTEAQAASSAQPQGVSSSSYWDYLIAAAATVAGESAARESSDPRGPPGTLVPGRQVDTLDC